MPERTAAVFVADRPLADQVALLEGDVQALVTRSVLNGGQGRALLAKLAVAERHLRQGALAPARGELGAFVNQVEAFGRTNVLPAVQAEALRAEALALLALIGG